MKLKQTEHRGHVLTQDSESPLSLAHHHQVRRCDSCTWVTSTCHQQRAILETLIGIIHSVVCSLRTVSAMVPQWSLPLTLNVDMSKPMDYVNLSSATSTVQNRAVNIHSEAYALSNCSLLQLSGLSHSPRCMGA